jgi:hypothetical protein
MTIKLDILSNLDEMDIWLNATTSKMVPKALKRALQRSGKTLVTESQRRIRQQRNLKARDIKQKFFKVTKRLGKNPEKMEVVLAVADEPLKLSIFLRGTTRPRSQKGIKVSKRKGLRIKIKPGRAKRVKGAFIAKGPKSGKYEVFKRMKTKGSDRGPLALQSAPSLHLFFIDSAFRRRIEKIVGAKLQKEFQQQFLHLLNKAGPKGKLR